MVEVRDFEKQKRLGEFTLSKKDNILERGELLYDKTKVMQMTNLYIKKNLMDLMKQRKYYESIDEEQVNRKRF